MRRFSFLPIILSLALTACGQSKPTNYYILKSTAAPVSVESMPRTTLGIVGVNLPGYLDRAGIVLLDENGTLINIPQFNKWAEGLDAGAARLLTAARLAKQHSLPVLISGGQVFSDGASEALVAERILLQLGLPQEQIIVETQARTTKENAAYSAALCRERGYKNVLLLTSALHMPRSMQFFERYLGGHGIKVAAYPCDYTLNPKGQFNPRWLVPQLQAFDITCMALHEYVGMAGAFLQR